MSRSVSARTGDLRPTAGVLVRPSGSSLLQASLFEAAFEHSFTGMALVAPDGRWIRVNRALCRMLRRAPAELASLRFGDVVEGDVDAAEMPILAEVFAGHRTAAQVERQVRLGTGELAWARMSLALVADEAGAGPGVVVAQIEDITSQRAAEAASALAAGELRRSNLELEAFAAVAAHDLQEPLRKIRAFGDRLERRYGENLGSDGLDYLTRMITAAARMQALIDALLAYARVATVAPRFEPVSLDDAVRDVVADLHWAIERSRAQVVVGGELGGVIGDSAQIHQLFLNLVSNALKFTSPDRTPLVTIGREASRVANHVEIVVEDNGIGFDEEYADRIFAPFERLHSRADYEGTGIGLAIARRIAERHGGSIVADGRPGVGARFVVMLSTANPVGAE